MIVHIYASVCTQIIWKSQVTGLIFIFHKNIINI